MNVTITDLSPVEKKLDFIVPAETVKKALDKSYEKVRQKAKIKGFRPGKVPRPILERYYGPQVQTEVTVSLVQEYFGKAIAEHSLTPVSQPVIENKELKAGEDFQFSVRIEVEPRIEEVRGFEGIELEGKKIDVSEEEVSAQLLQLQQMHARVEVLPQERPAQEGDYLVIDYEGNIEGRAFPGGSAKDFAVVLGSGILIPGFEEKLVGMSKGERKKISLIYPEKYRVGDLAGKEILFIVLVKDIKERKIPALDDEFAKEFGEFNSLGDLKEKIREGIRQREERKVRDEFKQRVVKALIEENPLELPRSLIEDQARYLASRRRESLGAAGHGESEGATLNIEEEDRIEAREEVHGRLLLNALARLQDIKVEEKELSERLEFIAKGLQQPLRAVMDFYKKENRMQALEAGMVREKTLDFILEKAKIKFD